VSVLHTGRPAPDEGPQGRPEALPAGSGDHIGRFTELVATAIANAEAQIALTASRARIVTSADQTTGASSATCTTAPSNAWSPSPCSCAPPGGVVITDDLGSQGSRRQW
jgi:hypothetical protein